MKPAPKKYDPLLQNGELSYDTHKKRTPIKLRSAGPVLLAAWIAAVSSLNAAESFSQPLTADAGSEPAAHIEVPALSPWQNGVGEGFRSSVQTFSIETGFALGDLLGHRQNHDLALASLSYGHMLTPVLGEGHWYRGNFELRGELFGGGQYHPTSEWLIGLTPHIRYDFATGTRLVPYIDGGAGVTATGIGMPDLGGRFEFNLQSGVGMHWFIRDNLALTAEAHYLHLSCADIYTSNRGINDIAAMFGITKFF